LKLAVPFETKGGCDLCDSFMNWSFDQNVDNPQAPPDTSVDLVHNPTTGCPRKSPDDAQPIVQFVRAASLL